MLPSKGWLVVDIETDGGPWDGDLLAVGVCDPVTMDATCYFGGVPDWLRAALADPETGIVEQTLYDARWLSLYGLEVNGPIADTRLMAWNVDENLENFKLESLAMRYCQVRMDKRIVRRKGVPVFRTDEGDLVPMGEAPRDQLERYLTGDIVTTAQLFNVLEPQQPDYWDRQIELTSVLLGMETAGLPYDHETLEGLAFQYRERLYALAEELTRKLPRTFNLGSDDQVAALLFLREFKLPARYRKGEEPEDFEVEKVARLYSHGCHTIKGFGLSPREWTESGKRPKVDHDTLTFFAGHPWVDKYLEYQKIVKVLTYLDSFPRFAHEGRIYGTFNQAGTKTGRLSSADPNMQNIPRRGVLGSEVRSLFTGKLIVADFSQLEPRLMAHWSKDPEMLRVYEEGLDIYRLLAEASFGSAYDDVSPEERDQSKVVFLGLSYGLMARKLAYKLTVSGYPTRQKQAQAYLEGARDRFSRFFEWREEKIAEARINGYVLTIGGRKRHLDFHGADAWRVERQTVNSVIQGSAADIVNETMLIIADGLPDHRLLVQVHDEVVVEYEDVPNVQFIQEAGEWRHGFTLNVPLVFEPKVVESWGEK